MKAKYFVLLAFIVGYFTGSLWMMIDGIHLGNILIVIAGTIIAILLSSKVEVKATADNSGLKKSTKSIKH